MKRVLKIVGLIILGVVVLLVAVAFFLNQRTSSRLEQRFDVQPVLSLVEPDSAVLARGEHLSLILACAHCHGDQLEGNVMMDMPLWRMTAPNLTRGVGGVGASYTVADWDRAIRLGVAKDGRGLIIMPSEVYQNVSDEDAEALIAYLQSIPAVDNELPGRETRFLGNVMLGVGGFDSAKLVREPGKARKMTPALEPTEELGEYLTSTTCIGCHGDDFSGMESDDPNCPPSPALDASAAWQYSDFAKTMRTGVNPSGRQLIDECMPWSSFQHMTDTELQAVQMYIREVTGAAG